jgi:hypothetical protein
MSRHKDQMQKLQELLDIHGGDRACWPERLRTMALELAAIDKKAVELIDQAARLDALLASDTDIVPSSGLHERILSQTTPEISFAGPPSHLMSRIIMAGTMAASLVFGVWLGMSGLPESIISPLVLTTQSDDAFADIIELASVPEGQQEDLL